jgi:YesN/AraC family two-component response regulator
VLYCLQKLLSEYQEKKPGFIEMMRSIFIEMLLITMRKISRDERSTDIVSYLTHRVAAHYAEPLSLSALARKKGYSLPYLSALFKERMGMGFQEYLIRVRIEEACRLLANTDKKISDIAFSCGFSDIRTFNRVFKKVTLLSPREYRNKI